MRYLTLLLCLPLFLTCLDDDDLMPAPPPPAPGLPAFSYLALGDSYTIGTAVDTARNFPNQLTDSLKTELDPGADPADVDLKIIAVNGWTTLDLRSGITRRAAELRDTYDLVTLLIGVNNQYRGQDFSVYETQFPQVLNLAIERAGGDPTHVLVISIPDYSYTPFGSGNRDITRELARYDAFARATAEARGVRFLDITPISQRAEDEPELVASDNLHPSAEQYRRWIEEVLYEPARAIVVD